MDGLHLGYDMRYNRQENMNTDGMQYSDYLKMYSMRYGHHYMKKAIA